MFQRMLVPLDGSRRALQALLVAAHLARSSGGSVIVLRVGHSALDFSLPSQLAQTIAKSDLADAERYLSEVTTWPEAARGDNADRRAVRPSCPNNPFGRILLPC